MTDWLAVAVTGALAGYLGIWLHELVHLFAVQLLDGRVLGIRIWPAMAVFYDGLSGWRDQAVKHAPFVVGLLSLPIVGWLVAQGTLANGAIVAWTIMTLMGGEGELGVNVLTRRFVS